MKELKIFYRGVWGIGLWFDPIGDAISKRFPHTNYYNNDLFTSVNIFFSEGLLFNQRKRTLITSDIEKVLNDIDTVNRRRQISVFLATSTLL